MGAWRLAEEVVLPCGSNLVETWKARGTWQCEVAARPPRARVRLATWMCGTRQFQMQRWITRGILYSFGWMS